MSEHLNQGRAGHEKTDADVKPILSFLVGLAVFMAVIMALITVVYKALDSYYGRSGQGLSPLVDIRQLPPAPRLEANPAVDLRQVRAWEEKTLHSYEWIDRDTGVFRIPIDRAMDIVADSGLPARSGGEGSR